MKDLYLLLIHYNINKNMSSKKEKFYITTPIYYVNAEPHIGHTYTTIAADILARYHRMIGENTFFATGTDEHGAKIEEKAQEAGKEPQAFVDEISAKFQITWDMLNISYNRFIRTTEEGHKKAVQKALQYIHDKGDIYLDKYEGLYCRGCEQFKNEKDLVDGKCLDHQTVPEKMSEETYVFKMSKYADELVKLIENDELKILPVQRKNEIISFYKNEGLKDISFSRKNVKWGVPIPWDTSHTAYVWSDAFLNYLTILDWDGSAKKAPKMWPADVQLMSKDILRVHATIWPAMLLSLELDLPKQLFIHGFFMVDGQKMSKSLGNVIAPDELIKKYGVDGTRYLLMSATPFGNDGDIGWEKFDEKYNADLANGLGNLVSRTLSMTEKYFSEKVPDNTDSENVFIRKGVSGTNNSGSLIKASDITVSTLISSGLSRYKELMDEFDLNGILSIITKRINSLDGYISAYKPFTLIKEDKEKTAGILYNCLESIRIISIMLWPFLPKTAEEILERLGFDPVKELKTDFTELMKWGRLPVDTKIKKGESLFPRISQN
ncbi:methionine--tRNA ligase [Patescibacteria group bacterium]